MIKYFAVAAAMIIVDVCWTRYLIEVHARKAIPAGLWSAAIMALSAYVVVSYVHDPWMVLAATAGAFIGTAATVKWSKK